MGYVLEWRLTTGDHRLATVCHLRLFRSAAGLKAFVRSRRFAAPGQVELRLAHDSCRTHWVLTVPARVNEWDPQRSLLPSGIEWSQWEADANRARLRQHLLGEIHAQLEEGTVAGLLSSADARQFLDWLEAVLGTAPT